MKYNDIKQRVYDILDLPQQEIVRLQYSTKIPRIFNEGLVRLAHSILPNVREYTIRVSVDKLPARVSMPPDFISFADEQDAYLDGIPFTLTQFIGGSSITVNGTEVPGYRPTEIAEYHIFYNALYPVITDDEKSVEQIVFTSAVDADAYLSDQKIESNSADWPVIIGTALPHYIAGQLLSRDDKVRSTECLNEFEILISTFDTNRHERTKEYRSSKGWY